MAKRFTDTNKYKKPFMRSLPGAYKIFWDFLYLDCDHAGIWIVDFDIAQMYIGNDVPINKADAISLFNKDEPRILEFDSGKKWFIIPFVEFQYGKQLVSKNRMHVPVISLLKKHNLINYLNIDIVEEGTTINALRGRITKKVKDEIFLRDQFKCQYCSIQYEYKDLVIDHIIPLILEGNNDYENLSTCCDRCNRYKAYLPLSEFLGKKHIFLNPTEFILKKVLDAPYKIPEDPIYKDKVKEKIKEEEEDFGKYENLLAPQMVQIFKECYPAYPADQKTDFPPCLQIAYKIAKSKGWMKYEVVNGRMEETLSFWKEIVRFSKSDKWFSTRAISDFDKEYQRLIQKMNNGNDTTGAVGKTIEFD